MTEDVIYRRTFLKRISAVLVLAQCSHFMVAGNLFAQALDDDNSQVLVVEDDAAYAGFILGRITTPFIPLTTIKNIGLIEMCWVETAHRNKGKARQLSQSIEAWFKEKNIKYVDLHYLVGNAEAEMSWSKLGYAPFRVTARKELA